MLHHAHLQEGLQRQHAIVCCARHWQTEQLAIFIHEINDGCEADGPGAGERHQHRQLVPRKANDVALWEVKGQRQAALIRWQAEAQL